MQLTTHTDYALRLLIYLPSQGERKVSTREVAEVYGISLHHLAKVAKSLTKCGWLVTSKGKGGGLQLAQHTLDTCIGEIVRSVEFSCHLAECFNIAENKCPITEACRLKPILYRARKAFFDVLDAVTVRDISNNDKELAKAFGSLPVHSNPKKP